MIFLEVVRDQESFIHGIDPTEGVVWCSEADPIVVDGVSLPWGTCPHIEDNDGAPITVRLTPYAEAP